MKTNEINAEIEKLRVESAKNIEEASRLERLAAAFPDLKKTTGRWNKVAYYSRTVNVRATGYDMRHNCGCCPDSPLEIWPYIETPDGKVYSEPPCFYVGQRHWMGGDEPDENWRQKLDAAEIPTALIERIAYHFQSDKEERVAAAERS